MIKIKIISLFLLVQSSLIGAEITEMYNDIRLLGMGDSGISNVQGYNSLYYNPAALANIKKWNIDSFFFAELGEHSKVAIDKIKNKDDANNIATQIKDFIGSHQHLGLGVQISYAQKNFGIGVLGNNFADVDILGPESAPSFVFSLTSLQILSIGYARQWKNFRFGLVPRFINHSSSQRNLSALEVENERSELFKRDNMNEGWGVDADFGMIHTLALSDFWMLSSGATFKHIINPTFKKNLGLFNDNPGYHPPAFGRRIDLGVGLEGGTFAKYFTPRFSFDYRNILYPKNQDESMWLHVHSGAELVVRWANGLGGAFRAGINQGYPTFGMSGYLAVFRLDAAFWTEELGAYPGQRPDTRFGINIGLDI